MLLAIAPAVSLMAVAMSGERLPFGFFTLTRFTVAATCFGLAVWVGKVEPPKWMSALIPVHVVLGILYQPILRIHLSREIWWWVNLATIAFLFISVTCWMITKKATYPPDSTE
jgi:hypothetical protein